MIEAMIAGQRDPRLVGLAQGKLRPEIPQLAEALDGHFGGHHAVVAVRVLAHLDFLDTTIAEQDAQIAARIATGYGPAARLLRDVPGIERATAEVIIAETGADMSRFPAQRTWRRGRACGRTIMSQLESAGWWPPGRATRCCATL
jgi:transposase